MNCLEDRYNQTKNHCTISRSMSTSSTLTIHPHHHHLYGHEHYHHQHQSHQQQYHYHHVQPPPSMTSNSISNGNSRICSNYPNQAGTKRCCPSCRCSNRLVTGIVITILPIAITSTLICVFMMQKTNLHQYAIYSFVIFCVAFVFPFALFFFTVVLNKLYKFYKREILSNSATNVNALMTENCDSESGVTSGFNINTGNNAGAGSLSNNNNNNNGAPVLNRVIITNNQMDQPSPNDHHSPGLICYNIRAYHHPYYYQIQDGTVVALAPENALIIEDSPPSYEMALLCPSVTHNQCSNTLINSSMQVILRKEQNKEKTASTTSVPSEDVLDEPKNVKVTEETSESCSSDERSHQEETSHQTSQEEL